MMDDDVSAVHLSLLTWADWMRRPELKLGYPSQSSGIRYNAQTHFDDIANAADEALAKAVDAAIDGLTELQRIAVYYRYLRASWPDAIHFGTHYKIALDDARERVHQFLTVRGFM